MRSIVRKGIIGIVWTSRHTLLGVVGCESPVGAELRTLICCIICEGNDRVNAGKHAEPIGCISQVNQVPAALSEIGTGRNAAHVDLVAEERSATKREALLVS